MRRPEALAILAPILLAAIVGYGLWLRYEDPASSPVIGAEDPYTHIVFTQEALDRGWFGDSQRLGTSLYPPGIHAFGGALATASGVGLYEWTLWSPLAFGAFAILGMYVLGARLGGPVAGLVAAMLVAVMPEHVFRTELYFPTALDLALLPAYLLAFVLANEAQASRLQRWGGAALFAGLTVPMAFLHPWAVPLTLIPAAIWLALRVLHAGAPLRASIQRLGFGAAMVVVGVSFAFASRWDKSDSGFAEFLDHLGPLAALGQISMAPPALFVVFVLLLGALAAPFVLLGAWAADQRPRIARPIRFGLAALVALAALAAVQAMASGKLPPDVSYHHMLGKPAIFLALGGLAVAFLRPTAAGDMGLAIAAFIFPLTAINVFDSPFWPQRSVAYLTLGVALLGASLVAAAHDALLDARPLRRASRRAWVPAAATLAAVLLVAGAVQAAPASTYSWYRLYSDAEFEGIQEVVAMMQKDPDMRVLVYSWQPALFLKALGADPDAVRYCPKCFQDGGERSRVLGEHDGPTFVVVDRYVDKDAKRGRADASWATGGEAVLREGDWRLHRVGGA